MARVEITETTLTTHNTGAEPVTERRRTFVATSNQAAGVEVRQFLEFAETLAEHAAPYNVKVQCVASKTATEPRVDGFVCTWSEAIRDPEPRAES